MKNKLNFKIVIMYCFLLFSLFNSKFLPLEIINVLNIGTSVILTIALIKNYQKMKVNKFIILILIITIYQVIILIANGRFSIGIIFSLYYQLIILLFLQQEIYNEKNEFLYSLLIIHNLLILINIPSLLSQINVPEYNKEFLLGGKNSLAIFSIPTIFYNYIVPYYTNKKISKINNFFIFISILTPLLGGSSTGFVVSLTVILLIIFLIKFKINFNIKILYILYLIILFFMLNTEMLSRISLVNDILTDLFNKDISFAGRTTIWKLATNLIKTNLFGYGRGNILISQYLITNECHNIYLQLLLDSGVPMLILFIVLIYNCIPNKGTKNLNKISIISQIVLYGMLIIGLTESISYKIDLWIIITITYNLIKKEGKIKYE